MGRVVCNVYVADDDDSDRGRAPYGARGLKYVLIQCLSSEGKGRAPYGARGLKYKLLGKDKE